MHRAVLITLVAVSAALAQTAEMAPTRVAVLNSQAAVSETAEIKKAQADLEAKFKPRSDEMAKLQKELADIQNRMQTGQNTLTPQALQDLQIDGQRKQRELQRLNEDLQGDVDRARNEILQRVGNRMQQVVQKLAEAKGLDVVVDVSNTVYYKPALDLTKEATAAYDKAYPVQ